MIFDQHEIRTLQSLLQDYKSIVTNHGYSVGDMKSSYLKVLLQSEYKENIGFQVRKERNLSDWVYNTIGGRDYIQCAVDSLGFTDEELIKNVII